MSKIDLRSISDDFPTSNTFAFLQKKADDAILRVQQALGRTPTSKGQYVTIHYGATFNKKHIRLLSVFLFLICVSSAAIYGGCYYTFYWKPCTKKFQFEKITAADTHTCAADVHCMWEKEKYQNKWTENKCARRNTESRCTQIN